MRRYSCVLCMALAIVCGRDAFAEVKVETQVIGKSLEGRPIECQVLGDGKDVFWFIATIHGNEAAGTPLAAKFVEWLKANPKELEGRRVVITPVANPDGFADNVRHNKNGVDLNRNFPAGNFDAAVKVHGETPLSEPESRALMRVMMTYFPDRIVTIHQPLDCMDYDGEESKKMAKVMAEKCRLPFKQVGSRPGSLGSFVGLTMGKPIVTVELPGDAGMDGDKLWKEYGEAMIAGLRYKQADSDGEGK